MKKAIGLTVLLILLCGNLVVWAGPALANKSSVFDQIDLLVDIRHELVAQYVEEPDQNKMVQTAVKGMIESLNDPFTVYVAPEDLGGFDKAIRGTFFGIGAEVDIHEDRLRIVTPLEGSPAWKAGVMAGDTVLEINGESTLGLKINEAISKLTGPENTQVKLKVRHESGEEAELIITRQRINMQTVKGYRRGADGSWHFMIDTQNKVGYIRLSQFTEPSAEELRKALRQLKTQDVKGIILDMRFNPGGLLESAVEISDMFLEKGQRIVSVKGRAVPERVEYSTDKDESTQVPLVVLANESSASAAEVVTGALTDNDRALFVGTRTFGKGSVQQILMLDNNQGALKITNAYYYLPKGRNIHRRPNSEVWGVDPSEGCYVTMTPDEIKKMAEVRRQGDVLHRPGEDKNNGAAQPVTPELIRTQASDPQLAAGLEAVLGKIASGKWPQVGKSGAQMIARQTKHDTLVRQRDALKQRLEEINTEISKLDAPAPANTGSKATSAAPSTQPAGDKDPSK